MDEVKLGKGDQSWANVDCGDTEGLEEMEVVFNYVEDEDMMMVLVRCVLCEKCCRKMQRATEKQRDGNRSRRYDRYKHDKDKNKERYHYRHRGHTSSKHRSKKRRREHGQDDEWEQGKNRSNVENTKTKSVARE